MPSDTYLSLFLLESNRIENIEGLSIDDLKAAREFMDNDHVTVSDMVALAHEFTSGVGKLRNYVGADVRVGRSVPPAGGPRMPKLLEGILDDAMDKTKNSFDVHVDYEHLHPFLDGNGRTGRLLWLWKLVHAPGPEDEFFTRFIAQNPGNFLQAFYYQMLGSRYTAPRS